MQILSIQSWVAYGHVGNAAAVFPLQCLGAEVWAVHTVHFSNHPGYGDFTGRIAQPEEVAAVIAGIAARGVMGKCDAVLSGYLGDAAMGRVILDAVRSVRRANPAALYACDPVIGDDAPGIYVRPGIEAFLQEEAVAEADILTPNRFELARLSGQDCTSRVQILAAIAALRARMRPAGPRLVLVTSLITPETAPGTIGLLAAGDEGCFLLQTPLLPIAANGAGDAIAALFLFHVLEGAGVAGALENAASAIHGVLAHTAARGTRELQLIAARAEFAAPSRRFRAERC
ncbi:MAG: pyridoxal kinase PdxY [Rhodospirillales bacterium]|nr:pyridoxal kinase PdxY [Rhodospirillales bacterium]